MSNFITALIKQRRDAKKAEPNTNGRLKEIIAVLILKEAKKRFRFQNMTSNGLTSV